jgi:ribosomal protein S18 acetylase RimI-like enzyme
MEVPNLDIAMIHHNLALVPHVDLPAGYSIRNYHARDLPIWLAVQHASDPYYVATAEVFHESMPGADSYLAERVLFVLDAQGREVGSAVAWSDAELHGREIGHVHWVAIVSEAQGKGLAKPMMSAVCARMQQLGFAEAYLETNTRRLPAVNLYLRLGFVPYIRNEAEHAGWQTIAPLLKYSI